MSSLAGGGAGSGARIADLRSWVPEVLELYAKDTPAPATPGLLAEPAESGAAGKVFHQL